MQLKNTPERYGAVTKTLHWTIAVLILMMLAIGLKMGSIESLTDKLWVYNLHKSLGVTVLTLALIRIVWHLISKRPPLEPTLKKIEKVAAHTVHTFLYVAMIGMPLSGWLMSSAAGRTVSVFHLFTLPDLIEKNDALRETYATIHEILAYTLIGAIVLHVAGALKHYFIDHDRTLQRMLPFTR